MITQAVSFDGVNTYCELFGLIVPRSFVFFVLPFDESHNVHYYNNNDDNNNEQNIFLYESKMP